MNRLIEWFSRRRLFTFFLSVSYLVAVSLGHRMVSDLFDGLRKELSFRVYNSVLLETAAALLFLLSLALIGRIRKNEGRKVANIAWWLFTAVLVVGAYEVLVVFSVETIHFVQYAILAVPVFALTMNFGETVAWVTLMGALDEAYQYFVIYAGNKTVYFDFNDIILNLVGAAIGVLIIYTFSDLKASHFAVEPGSVKRRFLSPSAVVIFFVILTGLVLHLSGVIELYPEADAATAPIVLSRKLPPARFWLKPDVGKTFHILSATQGILIAVVLIGAYSFMGLHLKKGRKVK